MLRHSLAYVGAVPSASLVADMPFMVHLPVFQHFAEAAATCRFLLTQREGAWSVIDLELGERVSLCVDFIEGRLAHRRHQGGNRNEDLCRSLGLRQTTALSICDATAGLGRDAFVMLAAGAQVVAVEREPLLVLLMRDGRDRALAYADTQGDIELLEMMRRMEIRCAESQAFLAERRFDVVYLDPMFPERRKSAAVKKDMQILQALHSEAATDEQELWDAAWQACEYRLVVKRPLRAPPLTGRKATASVSGSAIRYDIYAKRKIL